jgi:hypothetical protein
MFELSYKLACPDQSSDQAKYILALIASATGIRMSPKADNPDIIYGSGQSPDTLVIPWQPAESSVSWNKTSFEGISLYLPQAMNGVLINPAERRFTFDFIATLGAFLEKQLAAFNNQKSANTERPSGLSSEFDGFIRLFVKTLKVCGKIPADFSPKSPWPDNGSFALGLSHDIDILKRRIPGSLIILTQALSRGKYHGNLNGAWHGLLDSVASQILGARNPFCNFESYYSCGHQSTTFVFPGNRQDRRDPTYVLDSIGAELAPFLDKTELALHNGIGTWDNKAQLLADKEVMESRFGMDIRGIRPHYLNCQLPDFWRYLDDFDYSSSLGSDLIPGFWGGINIPLLGFILPGWKRLNVIELPIGLMDCALFTIHDKQNRFKFIDDMITSCKTCHGALIIDWHNTSIYENDFPGWFEAYRYLIKKAEEERAFIGSLGEISKIWRSHCESVFSY